MIGLRTSLDFNGSQVLATLEAKGDTALTRMGEHVLQQANTTVPIEEATLERSGRVSDPEDGRVVVYYDTPYAVVQHEDLTFNHDPGRRAKWLELTLAEEIAACERIAADEMRL